MFGVHLVGKERPQRKHGVGSITRLEQSESSEHQDGGEQQDQNLVSALHIGDIQLENRQGYFPERQYLTLKSIDCQRILHPLPAVLWFSFLTIPDRYRLPPHQQPL
jgi:hypothetical protein